MALPFLFLGGSLEDKNHIIDDIEAEGREDEEYTPLSKLRRVDSKASALVMASFNADGSMKTHIKARKSDFVRTLIHLDGKNFNFTGREYLSPIYNRKDQSILLKTARQVEKTVMLEEELLMSDGSVKRASDVVVGDTVCCLNIETQKIVTSKVTWKSRIYNKPCLRIKTRLGHSIEVATTHPLRKWEAWVEAGDLKKGDRVASVRKAGEFGTIKRPDEIVKLVAYMIAEGYTPSKYNYFEFTQNEGAVLEDFQQCLDALGTPYSVKIHASSKSAKIVRFKDFEIDELSSLKGKNSYTHNMPEWVYGLNKRSTALFINRLFSGDGHVKKVTSTKYDVVYASMSKNLSQGVQRLLWKFGIISKIRKNLPYVYKKRGEFHKIAYLLRIEGVDSVSTFLKEIGSLDKTEKIPLPDLSVANNNRDTLPKEAAALINEIYESGQVKDRRGTSKRSLLHAGLRKKPEYALSKRKAGRYLSFFEEDVKNLDRSLIEQFSNHINSDIYWDKIVDIKDLSDQKCVDFEVADHHNFITGGIITHNSTFLANNLVVTSSVIPFNKALYVSPSHTQTRQFSSEKLKPAIEKSPLIWRYLQDNTVSNQVFEKGFTNGSFVFLRSAFRSADRARGISARVLTLDEIQDLLVSDIPVIMECTSHFEDSQVYMAGTPKSFDNPIEQYWEESTQNEWLVPCGCGEWAFLDETTIAPTEMYVSEKLPPGPVCPKCTRPLNILSGKWFSLAPNKMITGYRIPQLMVPWIISTLDQWLKLLWKRDHYPYGQFANEVLGLSYDAASKPISRAHLIKICGDYSLWDPERLTQANVTEARRLQLTAGIDWGEGNDGAEKSPSGKVRYASYTVLTIGYYETYKNFKVVLIKKYTGKEIDPDFVVKDICRIIISLGVKMVGADWGHGWGVNNTLIRKLGHNKVMVYQYLGNLKERIKWDKIGVRWQLQRNLVMSELFYDMKAGLVTFPRWEEFEPYAKDILAIYSEYSDYARHIRYDHRTSDPDDFFHSLLLSKQTADIYLNKSRRYSTPN